MGRGHEIATTRHSVGMYACQRWGLKFSDESYIGYKNKTSRAIGSYKRSKSAIVLPSDNKKNISGGGQEEDLVFPDKKQLQPSWNSEWALQPSHESNTSSPANVPPKEDISRLSHHAATPTHNSATTLPDHHRGDSKDSSGDGTGQDDVPPIRPARPSALSRQGIPNTTPVTTSSSLPSASQFKPSSTISSSSSHLPDATTSAGTPVFTARPFVISQTGRMGQENSPRRAPPPVPNSPPFDPNTHSPLARVQPPSSSSSQISNHSNTNNYPHQSHSSPSFMSQSSLSSTSSPHQQQQQQQRPWQSPDNTSMQWSNSHNNVFAKPSQHNNVSPSSHTSNVNANSNSNGINSNTISILNPSNALHTTDNQPPSLPPPREKQQHRRESEGVKLNSLNTYATDSDNLYRRKSEGNVLESPRTVSGDNLGTSSGHTRQPSQEELECDLKAKQLAEELGDKEVKLSEVLSLDTNKKRMRYMDGLFSETAHNEDPISPSNHRSDQENTTSPQPKDAAGLSPSNISARSKQTEESKDDGKRPSLPKEYWLSASKAQVEMTLRHSPEAGNDLVRDIKDGQSLVQQKEELLKKLRKKLDVLEEDKVQLIQEIEDNNLLGIQVDAVLASRCNMSVVSKYKAYVEDQDKIVRLLLNLSGQLARAENAVEAIPFDADSKLKKLTMDKREKLHDKHEDAKNLKADIDKRKDQVSSLVQESLGDDEWQRYAQFINKKPQLTIELQELEDKIKLGTEQMEELKKSIPNS